MSGHIEFEVDFVREHREALFGYMYLIDRTGCCVGAQRMRPGTSSYKFAAIASGFNIAAIRVRDGLGVVTEYPVNIATDGNEITIEWRE